MIEKLIALGHLEADIEFRSGRRWGSSFRFWE